MLFTISATRNDGLRCSGTVDVKDESAAIRKCKSVFRPFTAKHSIDHSTGIRNCQKHGEELCWRHGGEAFTFTGHKVEQS